MNSTLQLQDLYSEELVRELIVKTGSNTITWTSSGTNQYQSTEVQSSECTSPVIADITWDFYVTKTQIGTVSFKYVFNVKRNSVSYITITDGPLPYTDRDSAVKELYELVETIVLQANEKLSEARSFVSKL